MGGSRPRGGLHLAGAVISPSEEDSHTFLVHAASSDLYKLRAVDARERQEWITRLRVVAELHSQALAQVQRQTNHRTIFSWTKMDRTIGLWTQELCSVWVYGQNSGKDWRIYSLWTHNEQKNYIHQDNECMDK